MQLACQSFRCSIGQFLDILFRLNVKLLFLERLYLFQKFSDVSVDVDLADFTYSQAPSHKLDLTFYISSPFVAPGGGGFYILLIVPKGLYAKASTVYERSYINRNPYLPVSFNFQVISKLIYFPCPLPLFLLARNSLALSNAYQNCIKSKIFYMQGLARGSRSLT